MAKANTISIPSGFNPSDPESVLAAIALMSDDGVDSWDEIQDDVLIIPPAQEVEVETVFSGAYVSYGEVPYALTLPAETFEVASGGFIEVSTSEPINVPSVTVTDEALPPTIQTAGAIVEVPAASVTVEALAPEILTATVVEIPAVIGTATALAPAVVIAESVVVEVPAVATSVQSLAPEVVVGDPHFASVSLLLNMDGSNGSVTFTDSSLNALTVTPTGNAQISTAQVKWGTGALRTTRSGGSLTLPTTALLELPGDFTIEFWVYALQDRGRLLRFSAANSTFEINQNSAAETGGSAYRAYIANAGVELFDNIAFGLTNQSWHHFALTRSGTSLRLFGGGTLYATRTYSGTFTVNGVAGQSNSFIFFDGYIDDFRITKGIARYTANFAPPTEPFPTF